MSTESTIDFGTDCAAFTLTTRTWLPRPRSEVFAFFADAENLDTLTPPWLKFHITSPRPIEMRKGARIDYKLRIHGLPVRWRTEITAWEPPLRFVDEQLRGPYRLWVHEHLFEEFDDGTTVWDKVRYRVPGGRWVNTLLVRRDLNAIFRYRQGRLQEAFQPGEP